MTAVNLLVLAEFAERVDDLEIEFLQIRSFHECGTMLVLRQSF